MQSSPNPTDQTFNTTFSKARRSRAWPDVGNNGAWGRQITRLPPRQISLPIHAPSSGIEPNPTLFPYEHGGGNHPESIRSARCHAQSVSCSRVWAYTGSPTHLPQEVIRRHSEARRCRRLAPENYTTRACTAAIAATAADLHQLAPNGSDAQPRPIAKNSSSVHYRPIRSIPNWICHEFFLAGESSARELFRTSLG